MLCLLAGPLLGCHFGSPGGGASLALEKPAQRAAVYVKAVEKLNRDHERRPACAGARSTRSGRRQAILETLESKQERRALGKLFESLSL